MHFCRLVWKDRLLTNSIKFRWGLADSPMCSLCTTHVEDTLHVLRDYEVARKVWKYFIPSSIINNFFTLSQENWLIQNLKGPVVFDMGDWRCYFVTIIWRLWTTRCRKILGADDWDEWYSEYSLVHNIHSSTQEIIQAHCKSVVSGPNDRLISWIPPKQGFVKINTDGSSFGNPGVSGAGGLIRDGNARWIVGFRAHLGICSNMVAELQALRCGLSLAWQYGFRKVIGELDAKIVIDLVNHANSNLHPLGALILDVRALVKREWECSLTHTLREGNFSADLLAKGGCHIDDDFEILSEPHDELKTALNSDAWGVMFLREFRTN